MKVNSLWSIKKENEKEGGPSIGGGGIRNLVYLFVLRRIFRVFIYFGCHDITAFQEAKWMIMKTLALI